MIASELLTLALQLASEHLHAQQRKDGHDEGHEDEHVAHLGDRLHQRDDDAIQPLPRLHQPQHPEDSQHAKHPQERQINTATARRAYQREVGGEPKLEQREDHDRAVEPVPAVCPVARTAEAQQLEEHLQGEEQSDHLRTIFECFGVPARLARVVCTHQHDIHGDQPCRHMPEPWRVHQPPQPFAQEPKPPTGRACCAIALPTKEPQGQQRTRATPCCTAVGATAVGFEQRPAVLRCSVVRPAGHCPTLQRARLARRTARAYLQLFARILGRVRHHHLLEKHRQEEVDDNEPAEHRHERKVDERKVRRNAHDVVHWN
eukprot:7161262-Prymnesium_polylepis.1